MHVLYTKPTLCLDPEDEDGYVCECCDPSKKKKGSESSEENSDVEQDETLESLDQEVRATPT